MIKALKMMLNVPSSQTKLNVATADVDPFEKKVIDFMTIKHHERRC